jgi:transposase
VPKCPARSFHNRAPEHIPEALLPALGSILETIGSLTQRIRDYERQLEAISKERYPETELLRQVEGVGPLTALTFVLTLEDPYRASKRAAVWVLIWGLCLPKISRETEILRNASPKKVMRCLA